MLASRTLYRMIVGGLWHEALGITTLGLARQNFQLGQRPEVLFLCDPKIIPVGCRRCVDESHSAIPCQQQRKMESTKTTCGNYCLMLGMRSGFRKTPKPPITGHGSWV